MTTPLTNIAPFSGRCAGGPWHGEPLTRDAPVFPFYESIPNVANGEKEAIESGCGLPCRRIGTYRLDGVIWNWEAA